MKAGDFVRPIKGVCGSLGGDGPYQIEKVEGDKLALRTPHGIIWEWRSKVEKCKKKTK